MAKKNVKKQKTKDGPKPESLVKWLQCHDEELGQAIRVVDMDIGSLNVRLAALEEQFTGPRKAEGTLAETTDSHTPQPFTNSWNPLTAGSWT